MAAKSDKKGILVRIIGSTTLMYWILTKIDWSNVIAVAIAIFSSLYIEFARTVLFPMLVAIGVVILLICLIRKWMSKTKKTRNISYESNSKMKSRLKKVWNSLNQTSSVAFNYRRKNLNWRIMIFILSILFQLGLAWINDLLF